ncbi:MAG TPA: FkbM family methyltransferase [Polyangia bacterium]|nr:FkbM family methyltransferase [Polyangia bacterium]
MIPKTLFEDLLRPGDLVFDVGAHAGVRTAQFLACGARVVAVDPLPDAADWLRRVYGGHSRVAVVEAAVGPREGAATLRIGSADTTVSTCEPWFIEATSRTKRFGEAMAWEDTAQVRMTTIGALAKEHGEPWFVKLDIEGFEPQALLGCPAAPPLVSFEFTPEMEGHAKKCVDLLLALDGEYRFGWSYGESLALSADLGWVGAAQILEMLGKIGGATVFGDVYAARPQALAR